MLGRPHWDSAILPILSCSHPIFPAAPSSPFWPVSITRRSLSTDSLGAFLRILILFLLVEFIQIFFGYQTDNPGAVAA